MPRRRRLRRTGALTFLLLLLSVGTPSAHASVSAAQQLARKYSPILMMRALREPCDDTEEQYWPSTSVDVVLGNPRVRLLEHTARGTRVIKRAPTAADLAGKGDSYYLDLPGNPLSPGCNYARDFAQLRQAGRAPAVTYAHIAREPGRSGFALQYWFFYYFNQFNDLHEADWEGMQLAFHADTPAQALTASPFKIVVFQHAGGEHADWDDSKVERRGTHPVVYSAAGSHATFYGSALYLGNGQNGSGVGCDNTTGPLITVIPRPILLPDVPVNHGPFAWLSFTGHWGQHEAGFNNGPAGPNTKTVWRDPFTWMDATRDSSPTVPVGSLIGPAIASAFCGAVARVSSFLNLAAATTFGAIAVAAVLILLILLPASLTRWRPSGPDPLRQTRALGQILIAAGRLYWRYAGPLLLIAVTALLLIAAVNELERLLLHAAGGNDSGVTFTGSGATIQITAGVGRIFAIPVVSAAVIAFVRNLEYDGSAGFRAAWRAVLGRLWRLIAVELLATILVIALLVTIIGIPFAIRKFVDWQLAQQEVLFEDRAVRDALRSSTRLVRGHWWHTAGVAATVWVLSETAAPFALYALLFTTTPITTVNLIGALISAVLLPYVQIGRTLLYLDLSARQASEDIPAGVNLAVTPAG